ncbi:hypothetical protein Goarm_021605, partial [Gossypium armourianum]|nr:hypothetical protein [Gossypium armourianum]
MLSTLCSLAGDVCFLGPPRIHTMILKYTGKMEVMVLDIGFMR